MKSKDENQVAGTAGQDSYHYTVYFEPQTDGSFAVVFPAFPDLFANRLPGRRRLGRDRLAIFAESFQEAAQGVACLFERAAECHDLVVAI